jgi:hypothetical protein
MKEQYLAFGRFEKAVLLAEVIQEMTIVLRIVFYKDHKETDAAKLKAAYSMSEINHRIAPHIMLLMLDEASYPDDFVVDMIVDGFLDGRISGHLPLVWERAVEFALRASVEIAARSSQEPEPRRQ